MSTQVIKHKCDFCGALHASKSYSVRHEKKCYKNKASKSCATCQHLTNREMPVLGQPHDMMPVFKMLSSPDRATEHRRALEKYGEFYPIGEDGDDLAFEFNDTYARYRNLEYDYFAFCLALDVTLSRLTTKCQHHKS